MTGEAVALGLDAMRVERMAQMFVDQGAFLGPLSIATRPPAGASPAVVAESIRPRLEVLAALQLKESGLRCPRCGVRL